MIKPLEINFVGYCPIQAEVCFRGLYLYFRSRGEHALLDVYESEDTGEVLPNDDCLIWTGEWHCWDWPKAGNLSDSDALYAFWTLWMDAREAIA